MSQCLLARTKAKAKARQQNETSAVVALRRRENEKFERKSAIMVKRERERARLAATSGGVSGEREWKIGKVWGQFNGNNTESNGPIATCTPSRQLRYLPAPQRRQTVRILSSLRRSHPPECAVAMEVGGGGGGGKHLS